MALFSDALFFFIVGSIFGSFLNVCIYRLPKGISIVFPRSFCPSCKKSIKILDNVPILSYLFLRGRCRFCGAKIPVRYFVVEILTASISLLLYLKYRAFLPTIFYLVMCGALLAASFIDLEHMIIPDELSLGIVPFGFLYNFIMKGEEGLIFSFLGFFVGGFLPFAIAKAYKILRKREGLGGGDVKLLCGIGSFLGVSGAVFSLVFGALFGLVFGIFEILKKRERLALAIPFGPFISLAAISYIFFGGVLTRLYLLLVFGQRFGKI